MRQLFNHPKKLFVVTLLNSTLTGIRAEDNAYSVKFGIKTEKSFKLPYTMNIDGIGKLILETVNSKDNRNGLTVPASLEVTVEGKTDYTSTPVVGRIIPSSFEAYMLILNAQIAGLQERISYESKATAHVIGIPAMQSPIPLKVTPPETTPEVVKDDLPF